MDKIANLFRVSFFLDDPKISCEVIVRAKSTLHSLDIIKKYKIKEYGDICNMTNIRITPLPPQDGEYGVVCGVGI